MTTPRDIILLALKDIGAVGEGAIPSAEMMNDAFMKLNFMLGEWQAKRYMVYHLVDLSITSTGAQTYSIGPGGDISVSARPDKIQSAFMRQFVGTGSSNNVDYPLTLIPSMEDYSRIAMKQLTSFAYGLYYDPGFPLGTLYPWPIPQANTYALHVQVKDLLTNFSSLDQVISLPMAYMSAMHWNLCVRLPQGFGLPVNPANAGLAKSAMETIRTMNSQVPLMTMPSELVRPSIYNIYSDNVR